MRLTISRSAAAAFLLTVALGCTTSTPSTPGASSVAPSTAAGAGASSTTAVTKAGPLRILVTNDDGYDADGIDAVVEGLRALPDTEVVVVAPASDQSGSAGNTTDGELESQEVETASGYPATAVTGFPADSIVWAIDDEGIPDRPHLVVSGLNLGQNIGPSVDLSGTIGAARAAASRGIPALAASQGIADELDYPSGVELVIEWVTEHRDDLLATTPPEPGTKASPAKVFSLNIPTCVTGELRELVEVPVAADADDRELVESDCETTFEDPEDDIDAFIHGYPSLSPLSVTPD